MPNSEESNKNWIPVDGFSVYIYYLMKIKQKMTETVFTSVQFSIGSKKVFPFPKTCVCSTKIYKVA